MLAILSTLMAVGTVSESSRVRAGGLSTKTAYGRWPAMRVVFFWNHFVFAAVLMF